MNSNEKLSLLITDLNAADFDVSLIGFDPGELDDLSKDSLKDKIKEDDFDIDSELSKPAISYLGDVWILGRHRLVCGDSTKKETFYTLMDGKVANLVVTDPPYNVNYEGTAGKIKNDKYSDRKQSTIWEFDKPQKSADHPTMKPVSLIAYPIMNSSLTNNIVLDPFGGSGSTLLPVSKLIELAIQSS